MKHISSIKFENDSEKNIIKNVETMLKDQKFTTARREDTLYVKQHTGGQWLNELHLRCLLDDRRETYGKTIPVPQVTLYTEGNYTLEEDIEKLFKKQEKKVENIIPDLDATE